MVSGDYKRSSILKYIFYRFDYVDIQLNTALAAVGRERSTIIQCSIQAVFLNLGTRAINDIVSPGLLVVPCSQYIVK